MRDRTNPEDLRNRMETTEQVIPAMKAEADDLKMQLEEAKVTIAKLVKDVDDIKAAKP